MSAKKVLITLGVLLVGGALAAAGAALAAPPTWPVGAASPGTTAGGGSTGCCTGAIGWSGFAFAGGVGGTTAGGMRVTIGIGCSG